MLTNPRSDRVKAVRALSRRSVRSRTGEFLAEGPQAVREAVGPPARARPDVYVTPEAAERHAGIVAAARAAELRVHEVSAEVLAAMCDTRAPQGLLAVCRVARRRRSTTSSRPRPRARRACSRNVRDPGNAGTVIRGADAAGADAVVVSDASVDVYNGKVVRSTAGSLFHLPVVRRRPGAARSSTALRARGRRGPGRRRRRRRRCCTTSTSRGPHAWVFGNEAWGLPPEVRDACDEVVRVPIHGTPSRSTSRWPPRSASTPRPRRAARAGLSAPWAAARGDPGP